MPRKPARASEETRAEAVRRILADNESVASVADSLGVSSATVRRWLRKGREIDGAAQTEIRQAGGAALRGTLTTLSSSVFGVVLLAGTLAGPFLVYAVFPEAAYRVSEVVAASAFIVGLLFLLLAIVPGIRRTSGTVLIAASYGIGLLLWVWSVQIVGHAWGIGTLYFVNFFLMIGAVFAAFAAALLGGNWSVLWQLALLTVIAVAFRLTGFAVIGAAKS